MRVTAGPQKAMLDFLVAHCPQVQDPRDFGPCVALGVENGKSLLAVAVLHRFIGHDSMLTIASSGPEWGRAARNLGHRIGIVAFDVLKCSRLTAKTKADNLTAIRWLRASGFEHEGTLRAGWDGDADALIFGCLAKDWRWKNGV